MIKELLEKLTCKHEWGEGKAYSIHNVFANICGCTHGDGNRTQWFRKDVCKKCGKIKNIHLHVVGRVEDSMRPILSSDKNAKKVKL